MRKQTLKNLLALGVAISMLHSANSNAAKPSINDMQTCQGFITFLQGKIEQASSQHNAADTRTVLEGLATYDRYIQNDIVAPGLLSFNNGDKVKADAIQAQVNAYKETITQRYNKRFPAATLYMDFAISLNECAKKAVPKGANLNKLKEAMTTLVELTQTN